MSEAKKPNVHTPEFKAKVGLEALREVKTINEIGQEYGVLPVQVGRSSTHVPGYSFTGSERGPAAPDAVPAQHHKDVAAAAAKPAALVYPYRAPEPGSLTEIAPGILWLRMPMPLALNHINLFLLAAGEGWLVVDTGPATAEAIAVWESLFAGPLAGAQIAGIVCTHFHADHSGLARMLCERSGAPLLMTPREYFWRLAWPGMLTEMPAEHAAFYHEGGYPADLTREANKFFTSLALVQPMPLGFRRLREHEPVPHADDDWRVLVGHGHSPEHAMLYCAARSVLISGDQLLPQISTNISVTAIDPSAEPLSEWLASLERLLAVPDETLVLPAHGLPFRGIHARVAQLRSHHARVLRRTLAACAEQPRSAYQVSKALFPGPLTGIAHVLALGESLSHLHHLVRSGDVASALDKSGVRRFRTCREQPA
jgi:glyoxylase-like metal-dependent hydrolase (beta-lactamase superfamily II)